MSASGKRKEDQPSSSSRKRRKTSIPRVSQGQGRGYQGQGQTRTSSQSGQMICYFCHQPGHLRRDFPQRQGSQGYRTSQSNHQWDRCGHSLFPLTLVRAKGTSISPKVLYRSFLLHREVRVWAEAKDKAHRPRLQGSRGMSMPSHHRLSQLINRLYRVRFCSLAFGLRYCLIMVHRILLWLHLVWMFWA